MIYIFYKGGFPNGMAGTQRILCYAKGLIAAGADIQVVIPCTTEHGKPRNIALSGCYEGVPFRYLTKTTISNRFQRIFIIGDIIDNIRYYWPFCFSKIKKDDQVFFYGLARHKMAIRILHLRGIKTVHELCEYPGMGRNNIYFRYEKWVALHFWFHIYDGFVTISENLFNLAEHHKKQSAKVIKVPILVDDKNESVCKPPLYNVPYIIHTGTMNEKKDGISHILKAFAVFKKKDTSGCRLVFTGPNANSDCIYIPMMEKLGIRDSVDLKGLVDRDTLYNLQHYASASIIYKTENTQTKYCFATKIGEVLIQGVPIITTSVGEAKNYITDGLNGYIVDAGDINQLAKKISFLIEHPNKVKTVGNNGRQLALNQFNYLKHGERLKKFMESL